MLIFLYCDGGARGNPGPAAAGAVLYDAQKKVVAEIKKFIGAGTNNGAEYAAVIFGLEKAHALGATEVQVFLDSKLVVEQVCGRWKVKELRLKKAVEKIHVLLSKFKSWHFAHIPREKNAAADALVNEILDAKCGPKKCFRF